MKKLLILLMFTAPIITTHGQNYKFQSLYIFNIAKLIEWPNKYDSFVIGVVGARSLSKELNELTNNRSMEGHEIKVLLLDPYEFTVENINMIYIGRNASKLADEIRQKAESKPILLIGDKPGLEGFGINFIDNSEKISFEIYPNNISKKKLKVSQSLLQLGTVIE